MFFNSSRNVSATIPIISSGIAALGYFLKAIFRLGDATASWKLLSHS